MGERQLQSFNGKLRDECLNGEIFYSLKEAQIVIEKWRVEYNTKRPRSSLGYRPPAPGPVTRVRPTEDSFTAAGCDVNSLTRPGTKSRSGQVAESAPSVNCICRFKRNARSSDVATAWYICLRLVDNKMKCPKLGVILRSVILRRDIDLSFSREDAFGVLDALLEKRR